MNYEEQAMWGSHLPALVAAVGASTGPVVELGVGHFSTPALHAMCAALGRVLFSVEQDPARARKFVRMDSRFHKTIVSEYAAFLADDTQPNRWGVAFIDHSPGGASRAEAFRLLIPRASYVVVHDYHLENEDHIAPLLVGLKSVYVTTHQQPPTLIASRDYELPIGLEEL